MSLTVPILQNVVSFDKDVGINFNFISVGGSQIVKNRLTIRKNSDNDVVYQKTQEGYSFQHSLVVPNNLVNGVSYNAYINTYDVNGNISDDSNSIQFTCYTTPTLTISNFPSNDTIGTSNYTFNIIYAQIEGELLDSITVNLYDSQGSLLNRYDKIYSSFTPPITLTQLVTGLEDLSSYKIQIVGATINGTYMETEMYEFVVKYTNTLLFNLLELENDCDNGYIRLSSNVTSIEAQTIPENPTYINDEIYVRNFGELIDWAEGFYIDNNITTIGIYMTPAKLGEFCKLIKDDKNYYTFKIGREVPYGETEIQDYFEVTGYQDDVVDFYSFSNYVDPLNNLSKILVWFQKNVDTYELILTVLSRTDNYIEWNEDSNVEYEFLTNLAYQNEIDTASEEKDEINNPMNITPTNNIQLKNGIYDYFYATEDNLDYTVNKLSKQDWDDKTKLIADFDDNTLAGNVDFAFTQLSEIVIKRRLKGTYIWADVYRKSLSVPDDLNFSIIDSFVPTDKDDFYEYALVPILIDGTEGLYITQDIKSIFYGTFISDIYNSFKLISNVGITKNRVVQRGILQPIGSRVPVTVSNSSVNYESGSVTCNLIGNFEDDKKIDIKSIVNNTNRLLDFLTNGNPKIVKDWNGNICLCEIIDVIPYENSLTTGITNITFKYVEQGKYDNQNDLLSLGMIKGG